MVYWFYWLIIKLDKVRGGGRGRVVTGVVRVLHSFVHLGEAITNFEDMKRFSGVLEAMFLKVQQKPFCLVLLFFWGGGGGDC